MTKREKHRQEWTVRIADYKASGLTMSAWCAANHCTMDQLKYWLRRFRNGSSSASSHTRFVPLTVDDLADATGTSSSLVIRIGQASIELRAGFDPHLLRKVVQALEASC